MYTFYKSITFELATLEYMPVFPENLEVEQDVLVKISPMPVFLRPCPMLDYYDLRLAQWADDTEETRVQLQRRCHVSSNACDFHKKIIYNC